MTKKNEIYKCPMCGNIISVLHAGAGALVCCGQPMELLSENSVDASKEKHVPVIEKTASGYKVTVGSVAHPMDEKHWIEWIELTVGGVICRKDLKPGEQPEAVFPCSSTGCGCSCKQVEVSARAYCNLHGCWKS
ncbi:desulfoferrodoxin [Candidatus Electronema sp. TJ]|uniref:desulfoferrodoxin n=1 Tax=Candidatus Electronema sp. TJ TaxID=3401573 RepID=UPI003AA87D9E